MWLRKEGQVLIACSAVMAMEVFVLCPLPEYGLHLPPILKVSSVNILLALAEELPFLHVHSFEHVASGFDLFQ